MGRCIMPFVIDLAALEARLDSARGRQGQADLAVRDALAAELEEVAVELSETNDDEDEMSATEFLPYFLRGDWSEIELDPETVEFYITGFWGSLVERQGRALDNSRWCPFRGSYQEDVEAAVAAQATGPFSMVGFQGGWPGDDPVGGYEQGVDHVSAQDCRESLASTVVVRLADPEQQASFEQLRSWWQAAAEEGRDLVAVWSL